MSELFRVGLRLTVIALIVAAENKPQLFAVTVIFPLVVVAMAEMEVEAEPPDQPLGVVQV